MNSLPRITLACFVLLTTCSATASNGDLDPVFGVGGFALAAAREFDSFSPSKPALQDDGKILICETFNTEVWIYDAWVPSDIRITRFNTDGSLDSSFGVDGKAAIDFDDGRDECHDLTIQQDGKIVAAGTSSPRSMQGSEFAIARLSANGTLDTTFGEGTGKVLLQLGADSDYSNGKRLQLQADGKLLIAGDVNMPHNDTDFAVARLLPDGRLDPAFGLNGKVTTAFIFNGSYEPLRDAYLSSLSLDAMGDILLGGVTFDGVGSREVIAVARLTSSGQLDDTFDTDGRTTIPFDSNLGTQGGISDIAIQPDGRIVLAGQIVVSYYGGNSNSNVVVARLLSDGALDLAFGTGGKTVAAFDQVHGDNDGAGGVLIQSDGSILVAGYSAPRPSTMRLTYNGALDTSYGVRGKLEYALPSSMTFAELSNIIMTAGHIYASGEADLSVPDPNDLLPSSLASFVVRIEGAPILQVHSYHARPDFLPSPPIRSPHPSR